MPDPFDVIFGDARPLPALPATEMPSRSRFELDTDRSGQSEVDSKFPLSTLQVQAIKPLTASFRNRQFDFGVTEQILAEQAESLPLPRIISRFYFKPTSYAVLGPNRWVYAGYRVIPHPTDVAFYTQDTAPNQDDPPECPIAHNTVEFNNDGAQSEGAGMNVSGPTYVQCNLAMLPIKGGVWPASRWLLTGGKLRVWFTAPNDHDKAT